MTILCKLRVIILGHMWSGPTRLQRLLACDPRVCYNRLHESLSPLSSRPRAIATAAGVRALLDACNPQLRTVHPSSPRALGEEFGLHAFVVHGAMFEAQWNVPAFARGSEDRDLSEVYREFRQLVQTLRWQRNEGRDRIQLLKAPQSMQELDAALKVFPDARLVDRARAGTGGRVERLFGVAPAAGAIGCGRPGADRPGMALQDPAERSKGDGSATPLPERSAAPH